MAKFTQAFISDVKGSEVFWPHFRSQNMLSKKTVGEGRAENSKQLLQITQHLFAHLAGICQSDKSQRSHEKLPDP